MKSFRQANALVFGTSLAASCVVLPLSGWAQIRTDGSLGSPEQALAGPRYLIPESLGKLAGNNLFHSFQTFNVHTGESASFTTATPGILNVISRVTGGDASAINGAISLTAASGSPGFYFINPAGVTFGAGASINVPGAFHVSTANYLKFPDGNFYADTTNSSTFSSAEPAAFGFLGTTRASISVRDAVLANTAGGIALVAGDLEIDHAGVGTIGGDILMVASGPGSVEVSRNGALPLASGRFEMINGSQVYSSPGAQAPGGSIRVAAGDTVLRGGSFIGTSSSNSRSAGSVTLELDSLEIDGRSAESGNTGISSQAAISDVGAGGDVAVSARGNISILGGGMITSDTYGRGNAGNVLVKAKSLSLDGAGHPFVARITNRSSGAGGNAGTLSVEVEDSMVLANASQISSDSFGSGQAGNITLHAGNDISVLTDSTVASNAYSTGNAGAIDIFARNLRVDGTGGSLLTQISSQAYYVSLGNAGSIHVTTSGALSLIYGGKIVTDANNTGNAGEIHVATGSLLLDGGDYPGLTGIYSSNDFSSLGNAGTLNVRVAGDALIRQSAQISSSTWGQGNAGNVVFSARNLLLDGAGKGSRVSINSEAKQTSSGHGGSVIVDVPGHLQIFDFGFISAATFASGNAGTVTVTAGQLTIDGKTAGEAGIRNSSFNEQSSGNAGQVSVAVVGDILIVRNGSIASEAFSSGHGGDISVLAGGNMSLNEGGNVSSATVSGGHAGSIGIQVRGSLDVGGGSILSVTLGSGNAGRIGIQVSESLGVGGGGSIRSDTLGSGNAGRIDINTRNMTVTEGGNVISSTGNGGNAGNIGIQASGNLDVGGGGRIRSDTRGSGNAGRIDINANQVRLARGDIDDFAWILSDSRGTGAAGAVNVKASRSIELAEGGFISSDSYSSGHAGTTSVSAPQIMIGGSGLVIGAAISSDTYSTGNAGRVEVSAQNVSIEGGISVYPTGITSRSIQQSSGNAGTIITNASGTLRVLGGGVIASSTAGSGHGGEVQVTAGSIEVSGANSQIGAMATSSSSGQPGSVSARSNNVLLLSNGGSLSIENDGNNVQPSTTSTSTLTVQGGNLTLNGGLIKANSTGNIAAGALDISFGDRLSLNDGSITTSANAGNGGAINIRGGQTIELNGSQITTSVAGLSGNGGDINIHSQALVMNNGFIQANTAARDASGGNVSIDVQVLLPSGNTLFLGGQTPYSFQSGVADFNVIQAAAPTGLSGTVTITSPSLDISGTLTGLGVQMLDTGGLGRSPCQIGADSSFAQSGRGGFGPSARDFLGPVSAFPVKTGTAPTMTIYASPGQAANRCFQG